ncbi:phosphoglucosamine mutase [Flavobacterium pectinovorum]|uniref:phosphoglucosamine mutase n=1 Tax=Flavobacterium pectinovorum TaxID=29533 RepID=UPI001FACFD63|nr:phosphoglucosamine mutase [Flavobacterium pectinovorum]MCI9846862.1 phosphoglucosamine mutase [Flavobacterium pectinovorum]
MTLIKSISGIRGTIGGAAGNGFTPNDIVSFTAAFGYWLKTKDTATKKIVIGRDARISGETVSKIVSGTLHLMGLDVVDLGLSTTPTVEMAVVAEKALGGIILTASHNPKEWNALKLLNEKGEFISAKDITVILESIEAENYQYTDVDNLGSYSLNNDYFNYHIEAIKALPLINTEAISKRKFKIAVDAVNSTGGIAVPLLLNNLGIDQIELLHCEPTGKFAHNPEPLTENLGDLIKKMKEGNFDIGIAVDPDVDRLVVICENGEPFNEEYTLVAVSDYVLSHQKGNTVSNLSSTRALKDITEARGGKYYSAAVGEVNVVEKMKEVNAIIGGEGNGGVIYPELHYGRDALVGIGFLLSYMAESGLSLSALKEQFPLYFMYKHKIDLPDNLSMETILKKVLDRYSNYTINTIDGIKIEMDNSWVHLRKSNTEAILRVYSEAGTYEQAKAIALEISNLAI